MSVFYRFGGALLGSVGIFVVFIGPVSGAEYMRTTGIAVFAVVYVIAQAVERIVEWVTEGLKLIPNSPGAVKAEKVRELRQTNSTINGNPAPDDFAAAAAAKPAIEASVDEKRTDIMFLAHGLSILLCAIAVNWMNYGFMSSIGATNLNGDLDRLLTALAAAGGSKGLHELIGRVQATKENAQSAQ